MNILIPVSPFVRKLIVSKFGAEPIELKASDSLTGELTCTKPGDYAKIEKTRATLTTKIELDLTPLIARQVGKRPHRVGLRLEDFYREKLNEYVAAKTEGTVSATVAIAQWCAAHDVEIDVDISFDALYKDWQRYKLEKNEKNMQNIHRQKSRIVRRGGEKTARFSSLLQLFSDAELDAVIVHYADTNSVYFLTTRGVALRKLKRQLQLYVYRCIGNRTPQYICQKFKIATYKYERKSKRPTAKKQPVTPKPKTRIDYNSKISYPIRSFKIFLKTAPPIVLPDTI